MSRPRGLLVLFMTTMLLGTTDPKVMQTMAELVL